MKYLLSVISSMKTMATLMLVFAVSVGYATFVENDFGTPTAKAMIYNARWFEVLLGILAFNLVLNIVRFKMWKKGKGLVFLFHFAFLVILFGAAVTRYVGYEGMMHIREGETEDKITSSTSYLKIVYDDNGKVGEYKQSLYLSKLGGNDVDTTFDVAGKTVSVKLLEYIPDAVYSVVEAPDGKPIANMMITGGGAPDQMQLSQGEQYENEKLIIDFDSGKPVHDGKPVVRLFMEGDTLKMAHGFPLTYLKMDDQSSGAVAPSLEDNASTRTLYTTENGANFVIRSFFAKGKKTIVSQETKKKGPMMRTASQDAMRLQFSDGSETKEVVVMGTSGQVGVPEPVTLSGIPMSVSYGAELIRLPFALKLADFELDRYPGSQSPMSYASDVVLIDKEQNIEMPYRIFMNHVLDHRNYRFFQSSYDRDEKGTILSVNHDPGTLPTYIGYLLLAIGMFGSLFVKGGRFRQLGKIAKHAAEEKEKLAAGLIAALLLTFAPQSAKADTNPMIKEITSFDRTHADMFGALIVQDSNGRMKPVDTLSTEILHKINRGDTILGLNANQILLSMMLMPEAWRDIKMIRSDKLVNKELGFDAGEKTLAFNQFFEYPDEMAGYKLNKYVEEAIRKAPGKRDKFDKAVIKVDERVNVAYMVYTGAMLRLWPDAGDANHKWVATIEAINGFTPQESMLVRYLAAQYFSSIDDAVKSGDWSKADAALEQIAEHQKKAGSTVYPDENKVKLEIWYNHANIFERLWPLYFLVGFVLLVFAFAHIINPRVKLGLFAKGAYGLLVLFFIAHTVGLAIRWYISGHAPWSNGYESMIYIGWASVLAGFIFSKNSPITLAATSILAGLILFVAHLNWMDPQVTNLVPVLQSYWLSIHVSMITGSYGFLGLGALLGFITLILFMFNSGKRAHSISLSIKELNAINEMSLMVGLATLTVGNFLGGVWANESWGRYWGWDPKETWALVTILVYAVVIHLRFIKKIYTPYLFSVISLLAFTSVLMTYFGVNYYLAGMHSYAKGDPVPIPDFVPVTYAIVFAVIALASRHRKLAPLCKE
ncbi:cytochrome c biogenesis protein CcsA [Sulfurimonas sp. HSL-3221]|uniref:cytochrome c biogenesis protein CcsA n=1 Tax=Sulfurimonadaceae TaxID=2771471 RepID=UPI001E4A1E6E|nr:cytochrome c biogenesis protein CcsA [Sulfurimonas sp. HSL-3221]UFS63667.1 cytochrome c biogenesis protein CcsA [Sulfurimonas sp. HSL-3221]